MIVSKTKHLILKKNVKKKLHSYSGTSNSDQFWGPSLVAIALEVSVVGRFYYVYIFYQKKLAGRGGRDD